MQCYHKYEFSQVNTLLTSFAKKSWVLTFPNMSIYSPWRSGKGRRTCFDQFGSQHLSGRCPAGSVGRDLNLQELHYQYSTTSVAVVLFVR